MSDTSSYNSIEYFNVTFPATFVAHVEIDRPKKLNSFCPEMFLNLCSVFDQLSRDPEVRCILLSGSGPAFSAGLDVEAASSAGPVSHPDANADVARRSWTIRRLILDWQHCISALERCEKPVIALLHGVVYGAAIDLAVAADIRYCTGDARFAIKEVDVGLAADVGTLTRLPKIGVPYSWAKEVTFTARVFGAEEAARVGFVTRTFDSKQQLLDDGLKMAKLLGTKSPVAVQGSKALMDFSRDRPVDDGLRMTASWNAAMVQTNDVKMAMMGGVRKTQAKFEKL